MSVGLRKLGAKEAARYLNRERVIPARYPYLKRLIITRALILAGASYFYFFPHGPLSRELILTAAPLWLWLTLQMTYFLRLFGHRRQALVLNFTSINDGASYWRIGFLHRDVIKKISVESSLLSTYLCIELKPNFHPPLRWWRSWLFEIYEGLFGNRVVIPLGFLQISEKALREQLSYYFGDTPEVLGMNGAAQMRMEKLIALESKQSQKPKSKDGAKEDKKKAGGTSKKEESKKSSEPGKHPVVEKVERIKNEVRSSGFDKLILELYYDYVRHFSRWQEIEDQRLSPAVKHIGKSSDGKDLETLSFTFEGHPFKFSMNMIQASSNYAKLSVWVKGQPRFVLVVRIEIAALETLDIERYIGGAWVETLKKLHGELYERDSGRQLKAFSPSENSALGTAEFNIDTLKEQFGIED